MAVGEMRAAHNEECSSRSQGPVRPYLSLMMTMLCNAWGVCRLEVVTELHAGSYVAKHKNKGGVTMLNLSSGKRDS